jgi:3',5'-cyclic AMP phosphodiesterase CpdA
MVKEKVFLHLSDIHLFRSGRAEEVDLDRDLRRELERSAKGYVEDLGRGVDGILVTGDVAYQGGKSEYEAAREWLKILSEHVGCDEEEVWVVPGNHDVQRSEIQGSMHIKDFHKRIRNAKPDEIDDFLNQYLLVDKNGDALLSPLSNYRDFAARYGCDFDHKKLFWEDYFELNDGWKLCLRGVNSALISSSEDDRKRNKLVLGTHQVQVEREPGVAQMVLCHHPPDWLLDYENVNRYLLSRTALQLYGHKHNQQVRTVDDSLRLVAGAVHPDRGYAGWEPRYNFLRISVVEKNNSHHLQVKVTQKRWNRDTTTFETERDSTTGEEFSQYDLPLRVREPSPTLPEEASVTDESTGEDGPQPSDVDRVETSPSRSDEGGRDDMDRFRSIRYRYFELPPTQKLRVALDLDLLTEEDAELDKNEMYKAVLRRAQEKDMLGDLWDRIAEVEGSGDSADNPFR